MPAPNDFPTGFKLALYLTSLAVSGHFPAHFQYLERPDP